MSSELYAGDRDHEIYSRATDSVDVCEVRFTAARGNRVVETSR